MISYAILKRIPVCTDSLMGIKKGIRCIRDSLHAILNAIVSLKGTLDTIAPLKALLDVARCPKGLLSTIGGLKPSIDALPGTLKEPNDGIDLLS